MPHRYNWVLSYSHVLTASGTVLYPLRLLAMKPTAGFAWPCLLHLNLSLAWLPDGVVGTHLRALLDCYLQLLSVWHVSLQVCVLSGCLLTGI